MNETRSAPTSEQEVSLYSVGSFLLRWRYPIVALGVLGAAVGLASALLTPRLYVSKATFLPHGAEGGITGLRIAASQLGISAPTAASGWSPPVYVELLRSSSVLDPIARDTVVVAEEGNRKTAVIDLLGLDAVPAERRVEYAIQSLRGKIVPREMARLGAVELEVTTRWPSVSKSIADRLIRSVNEFNLSTRKLEATAERQFAEAQAAAAGAELRVVEERLKSFLQRNRSITGSPDLVFENDRLQREVTLRQQLYTSLLQNQEEARLREVRNLPVITILEQPRLPLAGESRGTVARVVVTGFAGALLAALFGIVAEALRGGRRDSRPDASAFFALLQEATPRVGRRPSRPVEASTAAVSVDNR